MSGQQIAAMQQSQGQQAQPMQPQQMPFSSPFQSMPQQFGASQGFPMPNTQAARWESRPANSLPGNAPFIGGTGGPSTVSQLEALKSQVGKL